MTQSKRLTCPGSLPAFCLGLILLSGGLTALCGQGPSDHADLAEWLMAEGIESVSLNPDSVVETWVRLAKVKAESA